MKKVKIKLEDLMWNKRVKSINELSEKTGLARPTLHKLQKNESSMISFSTIETLCNYLKCGLDELLELEEGEK